MQPAMPTRPSEQRATVVSQRNLDSRCGAAPLSRSGCATTLIAPCGCAPHPSNTTTLCQMHMNNYCTNIAQILHNYLHKYCTNTAQLLHICIALHLVIQCTIRVECGCTSCTPLRHHFKVSTASTAIAQLMNWRFQCTISEQRLHKIQCINIAQELHLVQIPQTPPRVNCTGILHN